MSINCRFAHSLFHTAQLRKSPNSIARTNKNSPLVDYLKMHDGDNSSYMDLNERIKERFSVNSPKVENQHAPSGGS